MRLGLPVPLSLQSSNIKDSVLSIKDLEKACSVVTFSKGMMLRDEKQVFEFVADKPITVIKWDSQDELDRKYKMGEIILGAWASTGSGGHCGLWKVVSEPDLHLTIPNQPNAYGSWDTSLDPTTWTHRWVKIRVKDFANGITVGNRFYYMYYEGGGLTGCDTGGYVFVAKDLNASASAGQKAYIKECLKDAYDIKYDPAKDIKAEIVQWSGGKGSVPEDTIIIKSVIDRFGYLYFRTNIDIPVTYKTPAKYEYEEILSPSQIPGFSFRRMVNMYNPLDKKHYTRTKVYPQHLGGYAKWTLMAGGDFDCIALGHIIADYVNIVFRDRKTGAILDSIMNYKIDNTLSLSKFNHEYYDTVGIYSSKEMHAETIVELYIYGSKVELGEILAVDTLDAGDTRVEISNKFKDFSPKEQDQWGNIVYKNGVRVKVHDGMVEFKLTRYDQINRLMLLMAGNTVFMDASDSKGHSPDGENVFEAATMIGKFQSFDISARENNTHMDDVAQYSYTFEEIV